MLLYKWQHFLARGRGDGANDVAAATVPDQAARAFQIGGKIGMGIEKDWLNARAACIGVFMEREFHTVERIPTHGAVWPGRRVEYADFDWVQHVNSKRKKTHNAIPVSGAVWGSIAR
jgi:hypothetical protein